MTPLFELIEAPKECFQEEHLEVYGVRIQPAFVVFCHAFEGRLYKEKITIRNVSRKKVFVRIGKPTSYAYNIKLVNGQDLSPGLCLVRELSLQYNHMSNSHCILPIYIDGNCIDYQVSVKESTPEITFSPQSIDFGLVDANVISTSHVLEIRNLGTKLTRFYIDTKCTVHKLITDPCKGFLQPRSSVKIDVKLVSSTTGVISSGLWIKCDKPHVVPIRGEIIKPTFETVYRSFSSPFTIIDFPPTYVGVTTVEKAFIRNYSASQSVFCLMGNIHGKLTNWSACRKIKEDFKYFDVTPKEGMYESKQMRMFSFRFRPLKPKRGQNVKPFYFCMLHIYRIKCKYLSCTTYPNELFFTDKSATSSIESWKSSTILEKPKHNDGQSISFYPDWYTEERALPSFQCNCPKFFLHGIAEEPSVEIVPDELQLSEILIVGKREIRTLEFRNRSEKLPIIIAYCKTTYIEVDKSNFTIPPLKSIEISIIISPQRIGIVRCVVRFDLKYYDQSQKNENPKIIGKVLLPISFNAKVNKRYFLPEINKGITPNYIREVGQSCHNVNFDSKIERPKSTLMTLKKLKKEDNTALIAFPNDLQRSIRPWRGDKIETIFAKIPRYSPPLDINYEITVFDKKMKLDTVSYYNDYIRKKGKRVRSLSHQFEKLEFEENTQPEKMECKIQTFRKLFQAKANDTSSFLPLSPMQLNNIDINPMFIKTGPIAISSETTCNVVIKNGNNFDVRVYLRPEKPNLLFPEGNRRIVAAQGEEIVKVIYVSSLSGTYTTTLDIIVNECGVFAVRIEAEVRGHYLQVNTDYLEFNDENTQYIGLFNPLNADVFFKWVMDGENFAIEPQRGVIRPYSKINCEVIHLENREGPTMVQLDLIVADAFMQQVKLIIRPGILRLYFTTNELKFRNVPLNIPVTRRVLLTTDSSKARTFSLIANEVLEFIDIYPKEGIVYGHSSSIICVTLKTPLCLQLDTKLRFNIIGSGILELRLTANVIFPDVVIIPKTLKFLKIPSSTFDSIKFTVANRSGASASIRFDMSMYNEYKITDCTTFWGTESLKELILEKYTSKDLYMHFMPKAVVSDKFFLPVIINDILGPITDNNLPSKVSYFLTGDFTDCIKVELPSQLHIPSVQSYCVAAKLDFSRMNIKLDFKTPPKLCKNTYDLRIHNSQKDKEALCIRTDDLSPSFALAKKSGKDIVEYKNSIVIILDTNEEVILEISFNPDCFGTFEVSLPIYIKSDMSSQPHNVLCIIGKYESPTIIVQNTISYWKPGPLLVVNNGCLQFTFENHLESCKPRCISYSQGLRTEISDIHKDTKEDSKIVNVNITYSAEKSGLVFCTFTIYCTCRVSTDVTIAGCRENCFLTNYVEVFSYIKDQNYNLEMNIAELNDCLPRTSLMSVMDAPHTIKEEFDLDLYFTEYPLFPVRDHELEQFMNTCVKNTETWMYTQVFFGCSYYKIPTGINYVAFNGSMVQPPFIKLLIFLGGNHVEKYFTMRDPPVGEVERMEYLYEIYEKALKFLTDLGALFPNIYPELLLDYSYYLVYKKQDKSGGRQHWKIHVSDEEEYYRLSKQCWLDLVLQTYKVMVLYRLMFDENKVCKIIKTKSPAHERYVHSVKNIARNQHLFSSTELLLLDWLTFHYREIRQTYWSENLYLDEREIGFFGDRMDDGFVYAAVTLAYCPFLYEHFKQIYNEPLSREELLHNNIIVLQAWNILNFSLMLTLEDLISPHPLQALFTMVYLYQLLPTLYPSQTIEFNIGLSQKLRKSMTIRNRNDFVIAYKAILYGNDKESFEVDQDMYVIAPKSSRKVSIEYWAQFLKQSQCTLILSGECKGYHYAKSMVINLSGKSDAQYVTETTEMFAMLHELNEIPLKVTSPYRRAFKAKVQFSNSPFTEVEEVPALPFPQDLSQFTMSRAFPKTDEVIFNDNGEAVVGIFVIMVTIRVIPLWFYFRNDEVGDFCVKIITKAKDVCRQEKLKAYWSENEEQSSYLSIRNKLMYVDVPCQNRLMWNALIDAFLQANGEDREYWSKQAHSIAGMHILQKLLRTAHPYNVELCDSLKYSISVPKNCCAKFPPFIEIEDQCSIASVRLPIVVKVNKTVPKTISIRLESPGGCQLRFYEIHFPVDEQ